MPKPKPAPVKVPKPETVNAAGVFSNRLLAEALPQLAKRKGKVGLLARRFLKLEGTHTPVESIDPEVRTFGMNLLRILATNEGKSGPAFKISVTTTDKELLRGIAA
jgi:hypothetical protein